MQRSVVIIVKLYLYQFVSFYCYKTSSKSIVWSQNQNIHISFPFITIIHTSLKHIFTLNSYLLIILVDNKQGFSNHFKLSFILTRLTLMWSTNTQLFNCLFNLSHLTSTKSSDVNLWLKSIGQVWFIKAYSNPFSHFQHDHIVILPSEFHIGETCHEQVFSNSNNQKANYKIKDSLVKIMYMPVL